MFAKRDSAGSNSALVRQVVFHVTIGFAVLLGLLSLDDILNVAIGLSAEFRARWDILEILAAVVVVAYSLVQIRSLTRRIQFLEGLISVCMFCKKIKQGENWVPIETYISGHSSAEFSHGLCPECLDKHYPEPKQQGAGHR
jgi:hypothetical protein